ncbi:MAG: MBOAT family protein [Candidatus Eisenbacteria bacterium]|uniref:MBOAT family protein n=1 Tax=Eiseniibacteriota bacterium TaxID=2212470 RepID=A0A7Y2H384_UNCEI|nr:MBOAT family protein [Candidatus Eisenbacteria bacterium]
MLFNSLTFVVFFFALLAFYYSLRDWRLQKVLLLVGSYLFYAAWNPPFVILLWISTFVDWYAAKAMATHERRGPRIALLCVSLFANLGLLGFFKYGGFVLENFQNVVGFYGMTFEAAKPSIILPVGISFYTFQTMSYTLDVFLKRSKPSNSFLDFALYVTFFPQLVAGPIVRATHFLPQAATARRATRQMFSWGLFLMTLGMFQKIVLADIMLAPSAETVFGWARGPLATLDAWLGVLAFSGQIFFDFAGYSTTAIGAALCFGFSLPDNFRCPYAAVGFSDFWRRWHISLSTWLRDYLYVPLGGNRKGRIRTNVNLMITMLLGGLWHGASWNFVVWGGLHGGYLGAERFLKGRFGDKPWSQSLTGSWGGKVLLGAITYLLINIAWVFFRAPDFATAKLLLLSMAGIIPDGAQVLSSLAMLKITVVIGALLISHCVHRSISVEAAAERLPGWAHGIVWAAMLILIILSQGSDNAFIYFQF